MSLPRDVILDLLPVYLSGEASAATLTLVDDYLKQDPELAERVRLARAADLPKLELGLRNELELESLRRTRASIALQKWLFGFGIMFTSIGMALRIDFHGGHLNGLHLMLFELPAIFGPCLALGLALFAAYLIVRWRMRSTSL